MAVLTTYFWSAHFWPAMSALSGMVVLASSLADRKRSRRTDINNVGFMPWTSITVLAVLATLVAAALAIKGA